MLGLVREVLFNALFGTVWMGVFTVAFRIPNLLRDLFAEGALSTAFITVFSQKIEREGVQSAWALASKMMTLATVFMSVVTVLGILFAGPFVDVLAGGFKPEYKEMTILLTQIMFPFILLVSLAALVMGMLNSRGVFGVPALASSFFNLGSIAGGALFGWWIDPAFGERALIGLAIGTLVGGFLQLVVQLPSLRKVGFNFRPDFKWLDPDIRRILILMVPSAIAASAVQINVLVNTSFASHLGPAAISWLYSAFRLMQLPIGVFGVAVATITLPVISRIAANPDRSQFGPTLGKALRLAAFLTMPSAVGLFFLATPIISLIYEHREFKAEDSLQTGLALQCYALGLVFYSGIKVLSPAFYAIDRKWTPMMISFVSIGLNVVLNYLFIFHGPRPPRARPIDEHLGHGQFRLPVRPHAPARAELRNRPPHRHRRCAAASASTALGVICVIGLQQGAPYLNGLFWQKAVFLLTIIGAGAVAYMVTCWTLRIEEMHDAVNLVLRKIRRKRS